MYVPTYTLSGFVFAFQVWIFVSFERCNCWWIKDPKVIRRALGWSKKSSLKDLIVVTFLQRSLRTTTDSRPTIAEYDSSWGIHIHVLQFNEEFSSLGRDFMDSLNILFQYLIQSHYSDEDISNDFIVEDELRLCLEDEKRMRLEQKKNNLEEQRFSVEKPKRMRSLGPDLVEEILIELVVTSPTSNVRITLAIPTNGDKGNFPTLKDSSRAKPSERIETLMEPNGDIRHHFWKGGQSKWLTPQVEGNEVGIQKKSPSELRSMELCILWIIFATGGAFFNETGLATCVLFCWESILERAKHRREKDKRVNDRMMQSKERKDKSSNALDADLVVTESNETESERHVLSSKSRNDTHTDDADNNSVDRNTTPESTDMSHKGGEIDQNDNAKKSRNIDLESSMARLLAENTMLNKENEHLKHTYKDLSDSIKKTSVQTKDHVDSLIVQLNFVRQPNAFKSERPNFSKPRFASQIDVNSVLSKPFTPHYLPKVREYAPAKPHHVNAPSSSRNSKKESYGSNDMAHNYYLEEAKKKTQDKKRNLKPREIPFAKTHHTPNACTPKPRSNNQTSRNWPASKSCEETLKAVQKADHSKNPSSFSDFRHFVCSTCQKCVFNANHDACITKFPKEVNSHVKIQPNKTRNNNKPVDPTSRTQKPGRKIVT
nr:phospholipase-like protein [Tanacetum cinerariifolium]